jgi:hypothetical protein
MVTWPFALDVGRTGFQPHHMRLLQLSSAASSQVMTRSSCSM